VQGCHAGDPRGDHQPADDRRDDGGGADADPATRPDRRRVDRDDDDHHHTQQRGVTHGEQRAREQHGCPRGTAGALGADQAMVEAQHQRHDRPDRREVGRHIRQRRRQRDDRATEHVAHRAPRQRRDGQRHGEAEREATIDRVDRRPGAERRRERRQQHSTAEPGAARHRHGVPERSGRSQPGQRSELEDLAVEARAARRAGFTQHVQADDADRDRRHDPGGRGPPRDRRGSARPDRPPPRAADDRRAQHHPLGRTVELPSGRRRARDPLVGGAAPHQGERHRSVAIADQRPDTAPEAMERRRDHDGPTHHRHERRRRRDIQRQHGRRAQQQRHPRRYSTGSHATPSMRATRSTAASRSG
jgi:hypothetical protein